VVAYQIEKLKERPEFLRVASARVKHVMPSLILQMREHSQQERSPDASDRKIKALRLGFTVSKKVGNAVERNRVKRRLRAAAEVILPIHARPYRDFVIIGRQNALKCPFAALVSDLETALKKLNAYEDAS
jgi:ribonuclease P protein component